MRPPRHNLGALVCAALVGAAAPALAVTQTEAPVAVAPQTLCRDAAVSLERKHRIPKHLLAAISLAESGRWNAARRESFAWPWTVTSGGGSRYFETKEAALAHVRALVDAEVRNIDVGCIQVNLLHHPDAPRSKASIRPSSPRPTPPTRPPSSPSCTARPGRGAAPSPSTHSGGHRGTGLGLGLQSPPDRRRTTMTANDMMTLRALLEKSSDADLLREMIGFTAERLMAVEVEGSRTRAFYQPYRNKVYKLWRVVRRRAAEAHRAEVIAAYLERRARREAKAAERRRDDGD